MLVRSVIFLVGKLRRLQEISNAVTLSCFYVSCTCNAFETIPHVQRVSDDETRDERKSECVNEEEVNNFTTELMCVRIQNRQTILLSSKLD